MRVRGMTGACAGTCALLLPVILASPAAAADQVRVSADGLTWSADLAHPLFDPAHRWVPGESRTETFWVRNDADGPGSLRIGAVVGDSDALATDGRVEVAMRVGSGSWTALTPGESTTGFGTMAADARQRVDVRAWFRPESGNDTMRQALDLDLEVYLAEDIAGDVPDVADASTGLLPDTGAAAGLRWLAAAGALCLGAGAAVVARRDKDNT